MGEALLGRLAEQIRSEGPLRFDEYLEVVLYDPDHGFYAGDAGAGRGRDFLTAPEVGPLFGAVLARAID
ncbi:MAG: SAM-dependent methyltransferase, partial [Actinomycetota bacterium]